MMIGEKNPASLTRGAQLLESPIYYLEAENAILKVVDLFWKGKS